MQCYLVSWQSLLLTAIRDSACSTLDSGWDIHDGVYTRELAISNRENGYRDVLAQIDLSTFRRIPWENNVPFFLVSFLDPVSLKPLCVDPRGVLRLTSERAVELGFKCVAGVEYEVSFLIDTGLPYSYRRRQYFNFKGIRHEKAYLMLTHITETAESAAEKKFSGLQPLTPGS